MRTTISALRLAASLTVILGGALVAPLAAQHVIWSATGDGTISRSGAFAEIGDDDLDGWSDYVQVGWPGTYPFQAQLWVYSGHDGRRLRRIAHPWADVMAVLAPSRDFDRDGLADFVLGVSANALRRAALELRSARDGHAFWALEFAWNGPGPGGNTILADIDVDGDGNPDVLTGGLAYVTGAANGGYYVYDHRGQVRYARLNQRADENWPWAFANLHDVDGDGGDDFAVLVRDTAQVSSVDVVSGRTGTTIARLRSPSSSRMFAVSGTGDLDADGVADVVMAGDRVEVVSTATGRRIHEWGAGASAQNWWWYVDGTRDLDRDGVADVLATIPPGPAYRFRLAAWSGRDGSELWDSYPEQIDAALAMPLRTPGGLQRTLLAIAQASGITGPGRVSLLGWEPPAMSEAAPACAGALPVPPTMGMRSLPGGFRATLANAPSGAGAVLVLGTSLRPFDLSAFGFPGCSLQPGLVELGFKVAGTSGLDRGHARHDFGVPLAGAGLGTRVFGQWIVLATGPVLGGGTTETLAWSIR